MQRSLLYRLLGVVLQTYQCDFITVSNELTALSLYNINFVEI